MLKFRRYAKSLLLSLLRPAITGKVRVEEFVDISPGVTFGDYIFVGKRTTLGPTLVRVGSFSSIGSNCLIGPNVHPLEKLSTSAFFYSPSWKAVKINKKLQYNKKNTIIAEDVWVGSNSIILSGVHLGVGSVVGAGSVVTKSVPPYAIVAGNPARVIRYRFSETTISHLLSSEWWRKDIDAILEYYENFEK